MGAPPARLAELLGSLSLATDAAAGLPRETAQRTAIVAVRLGEAAGLQGFALQDVFYTGLLRFLGCTAYAVELSRVDGRGDDLALLAALTPATGPVDALARARRTRGLGTLARVAAAPKAGHELGATHCELAVRLAGRLGMTEGVVASLGQSYERWDGKGAPAGVRGEAIRVEPRVLHVAFRVASQLALEGPLSVAPAIARRRGTELDPGLATLAVREVGRLVQSLDAPSTWATFLSAEPRPHLHTRPDGLDDAAQAFGWFADVKSPWTITHSTRVAELASGAAAAAGLAREAQERLVLAARLHDVGRVAVPNGIWDKPGPLDAMERERMREHAGETERVLARSSLLAGTAELAGLAHERLDGRGYGRRLPGSALSIEARLLAAADVAAALSEDRPHRPALDDAARARTLRDEARNGTLAVDAVDAVLAALGEPPARTTQHGLTERQIEVLSLVATGLANKEIAARLGLSEKTVKRHLENVFEELGVRSRAAAAVFLLERGLRPTPGGPGGR